MDFAWSTNGKELLYSNFNKLYRINKDGSGLSWYIPLRMEA
jgi:hypothetical protein